MAQELSSMGNIIILGGTGFLGKHLSAALDKKGIKHLAVGRKDCDLLADDASLQLSALLAEKEITHIFNLVGTNSNISLNASQKYDLYSLNMRMYLNIFDAIKQLNYNCRPRKIVSTVASCAYPDHLSALPLKESDFLNGAPHPSVEGHAAAKRGLFYLSKYLSEDIGVEAVCVCPTTLYGPGDSLDPTKAKVVGSLIVRMLKAQDESTFEVWGTGEARREILYVKDAAHYLVEVMESYWDTKEILNLGSYDEFTISSLAYQIAASIGFKGKIFFNKNKPEGQMRKKLDRTKMGNELDIERIPQTRFFEALDETVAWYKEKLL